MNNPNKNHVKPDAPARWTFLGKVFFCCFVFASAILLQFWADRHPPRLPFGVAESAANPFEAAKEKLSQAVDINSAGVKELSALPGIGPKLAKAIMKDREANGDYKEAGDLLRVKGIGKKTLEKIEPFLRFSASDP